MNLAATVFSLLTFLAVLYQLAALLALRCFCRRSLPRPAAALPGLTLLKPLRGVEAETRACLASFLRQEYPRCQILFGVAAADDPVWSVVQDLQAEFPAVDCRILLCPQNLGLNPKVSTLRQLLPHAKYDLLVISDSDVSAPPGLLTHLAAAFQEPRLGLTSCLYRADGTASVGGILEALTISADFIPAVAVAHYLEGVSFALGAVMAVRREALEQTDSLAAIADYLADDYQLGHRLHQAGWQVTILPLVVATGPAHTTVKDYLARQLRWARTYRVCRPRGFLGYGITLALTWSLVAWGLGGLSWWGAGLVGLSAATRLVVAWQADGLLRSQRLPWYFFGLLPLKDLLASALWLLSFVGNEVRWQERRYRVNPDGRLEKI